MGVLYKENFTFDVDEYGTNAKKIVSWFVEKAGLDVVEVTKDTTSMYEAVCSLWGTTDVLLALGNNNSANGRFFLKSYGIATGGTTTVNGVSGYVVCANSYVSDGLTPSQGGTAYVCKNDSYLALGYRATDDSYVTGTHMWRAQDMCSGQIMHGLGSGVSVSSNYIYDGNGNYGTVSLAAQSNIDNGYVRVVPCRIENSAVKFYGYMLNPTDVSSIVSNGASVSSQEWTEYTIAGHKFVGMGIAGQFIKIS